VYEQIRYEVNDPMATITLCRPAAPTPDRPHGRRGEARDRAGRADPAAVAIVITGEGAASRRRHEAPAIDREGQRERAPPELAADLAIRCR
jgi:hypothetical protein